MVVAIVVFLELFCLDDGILYGLGTFWCSKLFVDLEELLLELLPIIWRFFLLAGLVLRCIFFLLLCSFFFFFLLCWIFFLLGFLVFLSSLGVLRILGLFIDIRLDSLSLGIAGYEVGHLELGGHFCQLYLEGRRSWLLGWNLDLEDGGAEAGGGRDELLVQHVLLVKDRWSWRALWQRPEGIAFLRLGIERIDVQELLDVVREVLLELEAGVLDAVSEGLWTISEELEALFEGE